MVAVRFFKKKEKVAINRVNNLKTGKEDLIMKTLQNNFTTPEQSKKLLELGVPAWTADCYYYEVGGISKDCTPNIVSLGDVWIDESTETMFSSYVDVPCWSVGRLIEIYEICYAQEYIRDVGTPLMEDVLSTIYDAVNDTTEQWNFSKLEE